MSEREPGRTEDGGDATAAERGPIERPPFPPLVVGDTLKSSGEKAAVAGFVIYRTTTDDAASKRRVSRDMVEIAGRATPADLDVVLADVSDRPAGDRYEKRLSSPAYQLDEDLKARFADLLDRKEWAPLMRRLFETAHAKGHRLYLVGGSVRDVIRGAGVDQVNDIDATGTMPFASFRTLLSTLYVEGPVPRLWADAAGNHETIDDTRLQASSNVVRLRVPSDVLAEFDDDIVLEYQMFQQRYVEADRFRFGTEPSPDVSFRDITVNSVLVDPLDGVLYDPSGTGLRDLGMRPDRIAAAEQGEPIHLHDVTDAMTLRIVTPAPDLPDHWPVKNVTRLLKFLARGQGDQVKPFQAIDADATANAFGEWCYANRPALARSIRQADEWVLLSFVKKNLKAFFDSVPEPRTEPVVRAALLALLAPLRLEGQLSSLNTALTDLGTMAANKPRAHNSGEGIVGVGLRPVSSDAEGGPARMLDEYGELDRSPGGDDEVLRLMVQNFHPLHLFVAVDGHGAGAPTEARGWRNAEDGTCLVEVDATGAPVDA